MLYIKIFYEFIHVILGYKLCLIFYQILPMGTLEKPPTNPSKRPFFSALAAARQKTQSKKCSHIFSRSLLVRGKCFLYKC